MLQSIHQLADFDFFIFLCLAFLAFSIVLVFIISEYVPIKVRYQDNPVVGSVASLIGIIYGVLVGLMALYLINNISYTADAVEREAHALAGVYRDSYWLQQPMRAMVEKDVKAYLNRVIHIEWPLMSIGQKIDLNGDYLIEKISRELSTYPIKTTSESLIMADMIEGVRILFNARGQRIHMSYGALNVGIWGVIILGTLLTLAINFLFGMNRYMHFLTVSAAALMTASMIYLLLSLDRPFEGEFAIAPDAFLKVTALIAQRENIPSTSAISSAQSTVRLKNNQ